ncbi:hypothetical protein FHL15_008024 [Xylaria flabelliformis]|uniref:Uncharacterized protein n=1 Tax=Xylaria flabelliformis TaxID=2512241 RepID=A0A553HSW2_9PEZI|nr:hypothetical protein FHL15_008024 [Xylaria flabelliformis]
MLTYVHWSSGQRSGLGKNSEGSFGKEPEFCHVSAVKQKFLLTADAVRNITDEHGQYASRHKESATAIGDMSEKNLGAGTMFADFGYTKRIAILVIHVHGQYVTSKPVVDQRGTYDVGKRPVVDLKEREDARRKRLARFLIKLLQLLLASTKQPEHPNSTPAQGYVVHPPLTQGDK